MNILASLSLNRLKFSDSINEILKEERLLIIDKSFNLNFHLNFYDYSSKFRKKEQ